ncbi:glycosyltransferase [Pseudoalteromonas sp. NEC-BIFX-2020_002]|uniref:Adhesion protein n=1 Tax=Pseudoalteromonas porphyrae TaxID=187330 RepID=A0A0N1ELV4_9GAMM|nr:MULTISPECIES: sugar transferase [Pseudoalteromonas]KPH64112.1 adhesion protein [Pseudoalteromonas porphyrae]NNG43009.1 glycosyltransferase [Pseudoalteromonas sp. NEC-BIFX-2020_002]
MEIFMVIFILLVSIVLYHHLGYPLLLRLLKPELASQPQDKATDNTAVNTDELPTIAILMCVYNEQAHISEKLHNLASLLYPTTKFDIHVYFDGCTDNSFDLAQKAQASLFDQQVNCFFHVNPDNQGKIKGINTLINIARSQYDILLFSDVSALLSIDALNKIANQFEDPDVTVTTGLYTLDEAATNEQKGYWQYQNKLKQMESERGAVIGVPGAMFAMRSDHAFELENGTINDDFVLSMRAMQSGGKAVIDKDIVIYELDSDQQAQDYARRVRLGAGNWQQIKSLMSLLNPRLGWTFINFFSHKVLRGVMPLILAAIYITVFCAAIVIHAPWAILISTGIITIHSIDFIKRLFNVQKKIPIVDKAIYIINSYFMALLGIIKYEFGSFNKPWRRVNTLSKQKFPVVRVIKRVIDIIGSIVGLVLVLPILLTTAIVIKSTSKGPVLFKQFRVGESTDTFVSLFNVYKFRSMVVDAEAVSGAVWASKDDPRITPVGRFIRKTRIDELPQLWNVLRGDMSLIGPRPERPIFYGKLEKEIPYFCQRTYGIKPGISGLAQVMNGYDETLEDARNKIGWDYAYVLSLSSPMSWLKMEISILTKTFIVVFTGKGQ